jgi:VCBS repeat protein
MARRNAKFTVWGTYLLVLTVSTLSTHHKHSKQLPATGGRQSTFNPLYPQYKRVLYLEPTADTSANVSIGDVNADGNNDILLVKGRHWPGMSKILLGDGHGHFLNRYNLTEAKFRSYSGHLVDLNSDGHLDIVLSNDKPDPKLILLNDGTGHFPIASNFGQGEWDTRNASIADLNDDGLPDIIVANRSPNAACFICLNQGKGHFDTHCSAFANISSTTITPADINHDGSIDLVVPHRDGGQSFVYLNDGKGEFSNTQRISFGSPNATIRMAEVADLNRDRLSDIVVIDDERHAVEIYFGTKEGTFSSSLSLENNTVTPYALAVADLNHDAAIDIIVGNVEAPSTVYFNDGTGHHYNPVHFGDGKGAVYGFAVADLDGDGLLDIATARSDAPNVVYFADNAESKK